MAWSGATNFPYPNGCLYYSKDDVNWYHSRDCNKNPHEDVPYIEERCYSYDHPKAQAGFAERAKRRKTEEGK